MRAQLDENCVIQANAQFWGQMLAMSLDPKPFSDTFCVAPRHLLASVDLSGVWNGRIEVRMTESLAYAATAAMLMLSASAVSEADALDAVKEIANIIGGVIKPNLPRPCNMTVPASAVVAEPFCTPKRTKDALAVAFEHPAGELMVRVWEYEYSPAEFAPGAEMVPVPA